MQKILVRDATLPSRASGTRPANGAPNETGALLATWHEIGIGMDHHTTFARYMHPGSSHPLPVPSGPSDWEDTSASILRCPTASKGGVLLAPGDIESTFLNSFRARGMDSHAFSDAMAVGARPLSIYVVEDSEILTKLLVSMLRSDLGVHVVGHSGDAPAAIEEIRSLAPDVAIVDLVLRDGTGFDVLQAIHQMSERPVALVLTNHSGSAYRDAARKLGVEDSHYFDKTEQIGSMCALVRKMAVERNSS